MKIVIEAQIYPSEETEKVTQAVENIFPNIELEVIDDKIRGESKDSTALQNFKNKLGLQAIRNSARREMKKGLKKNLVEFSLNKQAAAVDKVSFSDGETPLGSIDVKIETDDVEQLIDILAPSQK